MSMTIKEMSELVKSLPIKTVADRLVRDKFERILRKAVSKAKRTGGR